MTKSRDAFSRLNVGYANTGGLAVVPCGGYAMSPVNEHRTNLPPGLGPDGGPSAELRISPNHQMGQCDYRGSESSHCLLAAAYVRVQLRDSLLDIESLEELQAFFNSNPGWALLLGRDFLDGLLDVKMVNQVTIARVTNAISARVSELVVECPYLG